MCFNEYITVLIRPDQTTLTFYDTLYSSWSVAYVYILYLILVAGNATILFCIKAMFSQITLTFIKIFA